MYYFVLYTLLILLALFASSYDINKSYSKPSDFLDSLRDFFSGDGGDGGDGGDSGGGCDGGGSDGGGGD